MNLGTVLIYFSLGVSIVSLFLFIIDAKGNKAIGKMAKNLYYLSGISITFAVVLLLLAFITNRFEFQYVYNYSSKDLPLIYLISGFWAGQEGTFLLWAFLLFIFGCLVIRAKEEHESIILSVISITLIFMLFIMSIHNPFQYIWDTANSQFKPGLVPLDGSGLNPLLQNPWMIIHPPVLFVGYAAASVPFAYAIAALVMKDYKAWAARAYKWVLFCMTTLGIGIFLGAYWAYVCLGWGGYWGWDPVENSSLIPWLLIVALFHGLIIQKRKGALLKTNFFLTIISLVLVFYGTFLTRSGVLSDFSVHSFGDLGLSGYLIFYILFFLVVGGGLLLFRFKDIESASLSDKLLTVDNILNYGILTISFYALFILVGTSMPILSNLFMANPSSVTTKFYNNVSIPLGIILLLFIVIASVYQFQKNINKKNIIITLVLSIITGVLLNLFNKSDASAYVIISAYIFIIISMFIVIQAVIDIVKYKKLSILSSRLTHLGVGLLVIGVITSNIHSHSIQKILPQGEETKIEDIGFTFNGIKNAIKSSLLFTYNDASDKSDVETLYYINMKTNSLYREPYIRYGFFRDIYLSPVQYKTGEKQRGSVTLMKGMEKQIGDIKIKFTGFKIDREKMMAGTPVIFANLDVKRKNRGYKLSPGIVIKSKKKKDYMDVKIPGTARRIALLNWDIRRKSVDVSIDSGKDTVVAPASVLVEVSFKRLIWLVWLGTVLISAGGFLAYRRSLIKDRS